MSPYTVFIVSHAPVSVIRGWSESLRRRGCQARLVQLDECRDKIGAVDGVLLDAISLGPSSDWRSILSVAARMRPKLLAAVLVDNYQVEIGLMPHENAFIWHHCFEESGADMEQCFDHLAGLAITEHAHV